MHRIKRNTILEYLPNYFIKETILNSARVFDFNNNAIKEGEIIYLCEREMRAKDNFALQFAIQKSKELGLALKIIILKYSYENKAKQDFINNQILHVKKVFEKAGIVFETVDDIQQYLKLNSISILIIDFNPILDRKWLKKIDFKIYEIDGHNIIPARFVSDKQEYSAATFRPKIYHNIYSFLTEFENIIDYKTEADLQLENFIKNKLEKYNELRNNPTEDYVSNLSKYLNLGFISSQRVVLEVIKSEVSNVNKEAF